MYLLEKTCHKSHGYISFNRHSRKSLKVLGTVGEPINPEAWLWYYNVVGEGRCAVVDTFWQTETVNLQANIVLSK